VLAARSFPTRRLELYDEEDLMGRLTEVQGEPAFIRPITPDSFEGVDFVFFTGSVEFTRKYWELAAVRGCRVIDMSGALAAGTSVRIAGPLATGAMPAGEGRVFIAAHPAALVITAVLRKLAAFEVTRAVVNAFEPASERGGAGLDEMHQQTLSLLSFKPVPQKVFDSQVAFNLLAAWGEESVRPSLAELEERIDQELQALSAAASEQVPRASVRLLQAAVFHGHTFSMFVELEKSPDAADLERAFQGEGFDVRGEGTEGASPVGAASSDEIMVGDFRRDRVPGQGYWLWAAADNLRLLALNAVRIAEMSAD
jgi:aspartate-semialdehyde dehydrogenase